MIRNLKAFGLAIVAALALSAIAVPGAQAAPLFTAFNTVTEEHAHASIVGTDTPGADIQEFKATGTSNLAVECKTATFTGTSLTGTATSQTVTAEYGDCKTNPGGLTVDVKPEGCEFRFNIAKVLVKTMEYEGSLDVFCAAGKQFTFEVTNALGVAICKIKIPQQEGIGPIIYLQTTSLPKENTTDFDLVSQAANLKNTTEGGALNCGVADGTHETGVYKGSDTLRAFETEGNQIDYEVDE